MAERELQLFVYGTLKRGFANHGRYCRDARFVGEARVEGRLYQLPPGYPGLVIPEGKILAEGSENLQADLELHQKIAGAHSVGKSPEAARDWVCGEIFSFPRPEATLWEIDRLEDFRPGGGGLYRRVLAEVSPIGQDPLVAWLYVINEPRSGPRLLPEGIWPER